MSTRSKAWDRRRMLLWAIDGFAFIFPSLLLIVNRSDSASLVLLSLAGLFVYIFHKQKYNFLNYEKVIFFVFVGAFVVTIFCYLLGDRTDIGFRMLGRNIRLVLFVPIYILFRFYTPRGMSLFAGSVLAAVAIAIDAYLVGEAKHFTTRMFSITDAITFGNISLVIGFWSLSLVMATNDRQSRKYLYWLSAAGLLCGLIGSFLSGSRGGWIAIPVLIIISLLMFIKNANAIFSRVIIGFFLVIAAATIFVPSKLLGDRIDSAIKETSAFFREQRVSNEESAMTGCINDPHILQGLVQAMNDDGYLQTLSARVISDSPTLARSGWLSRCRSNYVIQVDNTSESRLAALAIPRSVINPNELQTISVLVRGAGVLSLNGGERNTISFNTSGYKQISLVDRVTAGQAPYPVLILPPHGELTFLPVTLQPGEYAWHYALQSIGKRLEMWRVAWSIFLRHPLLGAGIGSYEDLTSLYVRDSIAAPSIANYDHPHNDYLNVLYGEGLVGLSLFLLLIGTPVWLYLRALKSREPTTKAAAFCGIVMNAGILIFGLTESMFVHSLVLSWYVIMSAMFCAIIHPALNPALSEFDETSNT